MKWKRPRPRRLTGLGDAVHLIAAPLAAGIDHLTGTDLTHCSGCAARRADLNRRFPFSATSAPPSPPPGDTSAHSR